MKFAKHRNGSWDVVAKKYDGIVGEAGSAYHKQVAVPKLLEMLGSIKNKKILDIGCGQGFLCKEISQAGGLYNGVDISREMIRLAERRFSKLGRFFCSDASWMDKIKQIGVGQMDLAIFLLSISDMPNLSSVIKSTSMVLKERGEILVFMLHPCFRIPRQSGWGIDEKRKLRYRRIDSYLEAKNIPMGRGETTVFFRPLSYYVNIFAEKGWQIAQMQEIAAMEIFGQKTESRMERTSNQEIPMFLCLRLTR